MAHEKNQRQIGINWLTIEDVATVFEVNVYTVWGWLKRGLLRGQSFGSESDIRFTEDDIYSLWINICSKNN